MFPLAFVSLGGHSSLLKSMLCSPPALVRTPGPSHAWSCPCSALRASFLAGLNTFPIFSFFLVESDRFQEACCMEVRPALMLLHPYLVLCLWEVHSVLSWRNVFHLVQPSPLPMHIAWVASMLLPLSSIFSVDTCQRFEWFSWNSSQQVCDEFTMALNTLSHTNSNKIIKFPFPNHFSSEIRISLIPPLGVSLSVLSRRWLQHAI